MEQVVHAVDLALGFHLFHLLFNGLIVNDFVLDRTDYTECDRIVGIFHCGQHRVQRRVALVGVVRQQSQTAGIPMPEVGIYEGEPNAFATGPSQSNSLVAVSTGLLQLMNREEVEAVIAHELSHVKNGDMVTQTLLQGVMNTFVVFFSRVIGWVVDRQILRNEDDAPGAGYYITSLVLDIALGFLAGIVVAAFSRYREFHADAGAARIMGSEVPMVNALARLGGIEPRELEGSIKGFGISGGMGSLFATHPSIEERIAALREHRY